MTTFTAAPEIPVFHVNGLRKSFGSRRVFIDLSFAVSPGQAVGLLGANGAGKTTFLKMLLGLIPSDGGTASIAGEPADSLSPATRARIGYVPQTTAQFSWLTGKSMLRYLAALYPSFDWSYAEDLADRWKVSLKTPIGLLSPGQQQRLSIVRALAPRPDLLIFDEPISSLDPATRLAVIDELSSERERRLISMIFSSHITQDLERLCTHFAILAKGKTVLFEPLARCRRLSRIALEGPESALASLALPNILLSRKVRDGERRLVADRDDFERDLAGMLPANCKISGRSEDMESVLSEWMAP